MQTWRDAYQLNPGTVVFVDEETRTASTWGDEDTDARIALFYFKTRRNFEAMDALDMQIEYDKWWPKRDTLMEKFPADSEQGMKMDAFYTALHEEWKARKARGNNPKALAAI